ncbi:MAG: hypothetical protein EBT98_11565 [Opitutaceae bacterium]|nr:hypothetical protein [Opitutaceae bacterium]
MDNKSVVFQILLTLGAFLIGSSVIALPQSIDRLFYSDPYYVVEQQIYERAQRHAIYSFIIANLATPDFDPFKYLPPSDHELVLGHFPQARIAIIPDAGHNPHVEQRAEFVRQLLAV